MNTYMANKDAVFLDSNFLIAIFNNSDSNHKKAQQLAYSMAELDSKLYISNYILLEVLTVLSQRINRETAIDVKTRLLNGRNLELVHINEELSNLSLEFFEEIKAKNMSVVDCSILAVLNYVGIKQLLTFDTTDFTPLRERFNFIILS
jgi:predicted nucleic acid-binding protein